METKILKIQFNSNSDIKKFIRRVKWVDKLRMDTAILVKIGRDYQNAIVINAMHDHGGHTAELTKEDEVKGARL